MTTTIDSIDFFYLSLPQVQDTVDGTQDACLVRIRAGEYEGWGECEAAPLPTIASYVCPVSHSTCRPVQDSVLGQPFERLEDIPRIRDLVMRNSLNLLQAQHTVSGIDIALWDLAGKRFEEPVWKLLGEEKNHPKTPYASIMFQDSPFQTFQKAKEAVGQGFRAVKFGWGEFGKDMLEFDVEQINAAREGIGTDCYLMVDAGTIWGDDVEKARKRLKALKEAGVVWLEEPFFSGAFKAYRLLSTIANPVKLAGGEGCHNFHMAQNMIDSAGLGFVQINTGRVGGITAAAEVAKYADFRNVQYVNHTFTSQLALSASLQPFAGLPDHEVCEIPIEPSTLCRELTVDSLPMDSNGQVSAPDSPGLGIQMNLDAVRKYLLDVEIRVSGRLLYSTPEV